MPLNWVEFIIQDKMFFNRISKFIVFHILSGIFNPQLLKFCLFLLTMVFYVSLNSLFSKTFVLSFSPYNICREKGLTFSNNVLPWEPGR